jgi:hypothetical protein
LYTEINVQNFNPSGSSDLNAAADNGNETTNYINPGINGSRYVPGAGVLGSTNDTYLLSVGRNCFVDVVGGGMNLYFTSQLTTNGVVSTNYTFTPAGNFTSVGTNTSAGLSATNTANFNFVTATNLAVGVPSGASAGWVFTLTNTSTGQGTWSNSPAGSATANALLTNVTSGTVSSAVNFTNAGNAFTGNGGGITGIAYLKNFFTAFNNSGIPAGVSWLAQGGATEASDGRADFMSTRPGWVTNGTFLNKGGGYIGTGTNIAIVFCVRGVSTNILTYWYGSASSAQTAFTNSGTTAIWWPGGTNLGFFQLTNSSGSTVASGGYLTATADLLITNSP